ncbi:hypothetical protein BKA67DRAFT_658873 [Truncatella angustata]|uniref:Uncharacterized protein n=1 Tax=Truncatella angustata TaxID=152316 RepID=A0A9P8ULV7_9PEZI|nr:uncharacterized protein BKA67DRAFT_658873 [Truncatella angustata]KAH6654584.1 hypothetical protein BKA67DRAFT_658873 [Truncatella angustata]KAH8203368.1 hypothetical protein TruAng_002463 [Truncatella angustata]
MEAVAFRRMLQAPAGVGNSMLRHGQRSVLPAMRKYSSAPTVAQPSFWKSLIPKPWRPKEKRPDVNFGPPKTLKKPKKDWNPATFYIVIFLFIGSMSIQMISLRKDFNTHMRRAETKIGILREVVEKLQRGEDVDVEKALGTGDAEHEKEWENVLREIQQDDVIQTPKRPDRPRHSSGARDEPKPEPTPAPDSKSRSESTTEKPKSSTPSFSGFY